MRQGLAFLLLVAPAPALAHDGDHSAWTLDPWVALPLGLTAILFAVGLARLWARSDLGRAGLTRSAVLLGAGWALLAAALVSPLHEAGEHSFTMHMIEHEIIMLPAALLLAASRPGPIFLWAFPAGIRARLGRIAAGGRGLWHFLTDPVVATIVQAIAMIAWHMPALFDRALESQGWHVAQHLSFLVTALLFWSAMANGRGGRAGFGVAAMCLFCTSLVGGALGALMTFSASPWYAVYAAMGMNPAGLTPIEDQQLAGLLMWIPGGLFHAAAALFFLLKWLKASEADHVLPAE
jgi:cytochrome c oxidase assembly factor CtaG